MKNLFVITDEEKNRILGLHESATKNHYLINETLSANDMNMNRTYESVADCLGFSRAGMRGNCQRVMILDGNSYQNLISMVCPNGYIDFKNEIKYKDTTISGSWVVSDQNVTITMSDGTKFTGTLTKDSLKNQVTSWLVKQPKFEELVKDQSSGIKDTWKSWGGGEVLTKPEDVDAQVRAHAQYCGWGSDIQGFMDSGKQCPKQGSEVVKTGETPPPPKPKYYQEIVNLQSKVGLENTGKLDQATLKAIMDKLSQKV